MTPITSVEADVLSKVIRGETSLEALEEIGMICHLEDSRCWVDNPLQITVSADLHDIASGLLAHRDDPASLRRWALFIEAADVEISTDAHAHREVVLNALWDAAFLNSLDAGCIRILKTIVQEEVGT